MTLPAEDVRDAIAAAVLAGSFAIAQQIADAHVVDFDLCILCVERTRETTLLMPKHRDQSVSIVDTLNVQACVTCFVNAMQHTLLTRGIAFVALGEFATDPIRL